MLVPSDVHVMTILRVTLTHMSCAEARPGTRPHPRNRAPTDQTSPIPLLPASPCSHTVTSGGPSLPGACPGSTSTAHLPPTSSLRTPPAPRSAARRRLDRRCCRRNAAWHLHMFGMMVNKGWGGSRQCEDDRAAAPSTVRLGEGTRRYRCKVRAGSGQRARSAHSHARELGKSVRSAVSFAGMPGLVDADRARRARGRSAGEGLRHGCVPLSWEGKIGSREDEDAAIFATPLLLINQSNCPRIAIWCPRDAHEGPAWPSMPRPPPTRPEARARKLARAPAPSRGSGARPGAGVSTLCPPLEHGPRSRALARRHGRPRRSTPKQSDAWPSALAEPVRADRSWTRICKVCFIVTRVFDRASIRNRIYALRSVT